MKKVLLVTIALFLGASVFASPGRDSNKCISLEFEGNSTTGYSWSYTMAPEGIVREVSSDYRQDRAASGNAGAISSGNPGEASPGISGRTGAGGRFIFVFEGLTPGETELRFRYSRPWESNTEPLKTEVYVLRVEANGNSIRVQKEVPAL